MDSPANNFDTLIEKKLIAILVLQLETVEAFLSHPSTENEKSRLLALETQRCVIEALKKRTI